MSNNIPENIDDNERIIRGLFHPKNFHKKGHLLQNAFRCPPNIDEVSVIRLDYASIELCKFHCKKIEKPLDDRKYYGFALLYSNQIRGCDADVLSSPLEYEEYSLPQHADIKYGYIPEKNKELPVNIRLKLECIYQKVKDKIFQDPFPEDPSWKNVEIR